MSVRVFLEEIIIWISRLSKENPPHPCRWASSNPLRDWIQQKGQGRVHLLSWLNSDIHLPLVAISAPGSWAFGLGLSYTTGLPGCPACWWWIVGFSCMYLLCAFFVWVKRRCCIWLHFPNNNWIEFLKSSPNTVFTGESAIQERSQNRPVRAHQAGQGQSHE